jgi:hypothetical protein
VSSYPVRSIRRALLAKGFQEEQSHHSFFRLVVHGQTTAVLTKLGHGAREYGDSLLSRMARQMHLSRRELDAFLRCPMSATDYTRLLVRRGELKVAF